MFNLPSPQKSRPEIRRRPQLEAFEGRLLLSTIVGQHIGLAEGIVGEHFPGSVAEVSLIKHGA